MSTVESCGKRHPRGREEQGERATQGCSYSTSYYCGCLGLNSPGDLWELGWSMLTTYLKIGIGMVGRLPRMPSVLRLLSFWRWSPGSEKAIGKEFVIPSTVKNISFGKVGEGIKLRKLGATHKAQESRELTRPCPKLYDEPAVVMEGSLLEKASR